MTSTNRRPTRRTKSASSGAQSTGKGRAPGKGRGPGKVKFAGKGKTPGKSGAPGKGKTASQGKAASRCKAAVRSKPAVRSKTAGQGKAASRVEGSRQGKPSSRGKATSQGKASSRGKASIRGKESLQGRTGGRSKTSSNSLPRTAKPPRAGKALRANKSSGASKTPALARAPRSAPTSSGLGPSEPMRIAKAIARAGLCSRRDAERWIGEGRVRVNGKVLDTPALEVGPKDRIVVDGAPLPDAEPLQLWRYHKPRGFVTTHRDPRQRPTVFDALPPELPRVISIGRLDYNTEGLLLLTNDGALARHLELPATGWARRYRVRGYGRVSKGALEALKDGITVEGVRYGPITASLDSVQGANTWLTVSLAEGKNREVRKILEHLQLKVNRLIRISYGPFQLLDLAPKGVEAVRRRVLSDQLGLKVAVEMGLVTESGKSTEKRLRTRKTGRGTAPSKAIE